MRINCHAHVHPFTSILTPETLQVLINRLRLENLPEVLVDRIADLVGQALARADDVTATEQLLQGLLAQLAQSSNVAALIDPIADAALFQDLGAKTIARLLRRIGDQLGQGDRDARRKSLSDIIAFLYIGLQPTIREVTARLMRQQADEGAVIALTMDITRGGTADQELFQQQLDATSEQILAYPGRFLPFVFVNPRRADHFDIMERALDTQGFVGIKIYPSLGYTIDSPAMRTVWAYCAPRGLPIMQHCSGGGFYFREEDIPNCDPARWRPVLEDFPQLKICFAHFGTSTNLTDVTIPPASWTAEILRLIDDDRFPNVYTDISYNEEPMDGGVKEENYFRHLRAFLSDPVRRKRLLFGTDWFLVRRRLREKNFWAYFAQRLSADEMAQISERNPASYLGLASDPDALAPSLKNHLRFIADNHTRCERRPVAWALDAIRHEFGEAVTFKAFSPTLNAALLAVQSATGITINLPQDPAVLTALKNDAPFPDRPINFGTLTVGTRDDKDIQFKVAGKNAVFKGGGGLGAFAGLGVYPTPEALLQDLERDEQIAPALALDPDPESFYVALRWGYDLHANAQGTLALGGPGSLTLGVDGRTEGLFAVLRRFSDDTGAWSALTDTIRSWRLPRQVTAADDLPPGTWLVADVEGTLGLQLGAQLGLDFNWVRDAGLGRLSGDVGLRLQLGLATTLGFTAAGRYAVVLSRPAPDPRAKQLRLRVFKLGKKGWDFALNVGGTVQGTIGLLPDKADDFIAAVFGVHGAQVLNDLKALERWTAPGQPLSGLLGELGVDYAKTLLQELTGLDPETAFDQAQQRVASLMQAWDQLPHRVAAEVWALTREQVPDLDRLRAFLETVVQSDQEAIRQHLAERLQAVNFFQTATGRWVGALSENVLDLLGDAGLPLLQQVARQALTVLDGGPLENVLTRLHAFIASKLGLDAVRTIVDQADFDALDALLKAKLTAFLGSSVTLDKLEALRQTLSLLLNKRQTFYARAVQALQRQHNVSAAATFQSTTIRTALLDVNFDFSENAEGVGALLKEALAGRFDRLLTAPAPGVTLNAATLTHAISRQRHVELTLPFFTTDVTHLNQALAQVDVLEDDGRVLVYDLEARDEVTIANRRNSRLAIGAMVKTPANAVHVHQETAFTYSYAFDQAVATMKREHLQHQLGGYVETYFASSFGASTDTPAAASFEEWVSDLDKYIDAVEQNGTHNFGNTLVSLRLSMPGTVAAAWLNAPADPLHPLYLFMSKKLQKSLKELIPFYYFQEVANYKDLVPAQTLLAYAATVPANAIRVENNNVQFRQDDIYWDWRDTDLRRALLFHPVTRSELGRTLHRIHRRLKAAGLHNTAAFYDPDRPERVLNTALRDEGALRLRSLLFVEATLVRKARAAGLSMAAFKQEAAQNPSTAIEALSTFGATVTEAFNKNITSIYGGDALRPFGTLVFMEAAQALDFEVAAEPPRALLDLTVVGKDVTPFPPPGFPNHETPAEPDVVIRQRLVDVGRV